MIANKSLTPTFQTTNHKQLSYLRSRDLTSAMGLRYAPKRTKNVYRFQPSAVKGSLAEPSIRYPCLKSTRNCRRNRTQIVPRLEPLLFAAMALLAAFSTNAAAICYSNKTQLWRLRLACLCYNTWLWSLRIAWTTHFLISQRRENAELWRACIETSALHGILAEEVSVESRNICCLSQVRKTGESGRTPKAFMLCLCEPHDFPERKPFDY